MEENTKFCKFCGEKIDKDCVVCPKCGRQLELIKEDEKKESSDAKEDHKDNVVENPKFYTQTWFMWGMLIVFAPIGIFLMWKFHPEMKKNLKIILTVVFAILFIIVYLSNGSDTESPSSDYGTNNYQKEKKVAVEVADFSSMTKAEKRDTRLLNASRRQRIAKGSGTTVQDINRFIKSFEMTQKMMKKMKNDKGSMKKLMKGIDENSLKNFKF